MADSLNDKLLNMSLARINEQTVEDINAGKESAFAALYDSYYSYLCVFTTT